MNHSGKYLRVNLYQDGLVKTHMVHLLVLTAFAGPCPDGQEARHGPAGCSDNSWPDNLCWGTHVENMGPDRYRDGTDSVGTHNGMAKMNDAIVLDFRRRYRAGGVTQQELADEVGVSRVAVRLAVTGRTWKHV